MALEQRYRTLLEDAIQDAVFLSARNSELEQENQAVRQGKSLLTEDKYDVAIGPFTHNNNCDFDRDAKINYFFGDRSHMSI